MVVMLCDEGCDKGLVLWLARGFLLTESGERCDFSGMVAFVVAS